MIEKTDAETQQIRLNSILNVAQALDDETVLQAICDILELDFEDVQKKVQEQDETEQAEQMLKSMTPDDADPDDSGGDVDE